ncbi:MAG TPA: hypothetical protein VF530_06965 [Planctomycetota bacterium]
MATPALRPVRFLAAALVLGPLLALALQLETALIAALHLDVPFVAPVFFQGFGLELLAWNAVVAGLASTGVGWWMRRRILSSEPRELAVLALACALVWGPVFAILYAALGPWGRALPFVAHAGTGWIEWAFTALLGGSLFGLVLGPLFLPVTWPVTRLGIALLRWAHACGAPAQAPPPQP